MCNSFVNHSIAFEQLFDELLLAVFHVLSFLNEPFHVLQIISIKWKIKYICKNKAERDEIRRDFNRLIENEDYDKEK